MGIFGNKKSGAHQWRGVIEEYRHRLPVSANTPIVSLREGGTPLIYACNLSELLGNNVWIKYEGLNPTGSFKDSRNDNGYFKGSRRWCQSCYLCINWKYICFSCSLCR